MKLLQNAVNRGTAYLDENVGRDWPVRVDWDNYNFEENRKCIAGQLLGQRFYEMSIRESGELGFYLPVNHNGEIDANYKALNKCWLRKVRSLMRRKCCRETFKPAPLSLFLPCLKRISNAH